MRASPRKLVLILLALALLGYGFWQGRNFLRGPRIYLESPKEGEILARSVLEIRGVAKEVSRFTLNGYPTFITEAGEFREERILSPGVSIIELRAEDKFGHEALVRRTVFMK